MHDMASTLIYYTPLANRDKLHILIEIDFVLPRVAELLNHKEKQRGCPLLHAIAINCFSL